jgi:hypothetical protein
MGGGPFFLGKTSAWVSRGQVPKLARHVIRSRQATHATLRLGTTACPRFCDTKVLVLVPNGRERLADGGIIGVDGASGVARCRNGAVDVRCRDSMLG